MRLSSPLPPPPICSLPLLNKSGGGAPLFPNDVDNEDEDEEGMEEGGAEAVGANAWCKSAKGELRACSILSLNPSGLIFFFPAQYTARCNINCRPSNSKNNKPCATSLTFPPSLPPPPNPPALYSKNVLKTVTFDNV